MTLSELLESVRRVEVRTNRLVNDTMVGAYLSHFKGRGMDFEELREYIPGDEVRDIDWNVTYRMGRPFVKRYREERLPEPSPIRRRVAAIKWRCCYSLTKLNYFCRREKEDVTFCESCEKCWRSSRSIAARISPRR